MGNGISTFFESGEDYQRRCGTAAQQAAREQRYRDYNQARDDAQQRCRDNMSKDAWQGVSGTRDYDSAPRWGSIKRMGDTLDTPDCNQGPWKTPRDFSNTPDGCNPDFRLKPPSDFKWGNH